MPTAYPDLTEAKARALGKIGIMIYANHAVRAAVTAMRDIFAAIRRDGGIHEVDKRIATRRGHFRPAARAGDEGGREAVFALRDVVRGGVQRSPTTRPRFRRTLTERTHSTTFPLCRVMPAKAGIQGREH